MFSFFKRKPKENWRLVKTIPFPISFDGKNGKIYYHLFESNYKNRRIEVMCTLVFPAYAHIDVESEARRFDIYQEKIYRWEKGRIDPEIPTYDQVPEEETVSVLRGKI
jgi:hypothetical protein